MMVGLDKSFKPIWVYKMLQLSKPGLEFNSLKEEFFNIIEFSGLKSKKNVLTIIRRYYLNLEKKDGKEYFAENYLHNLSLEYSFESLKPVLFFVFLINCPIAQFLQSKINRHFSDQEIIDNIILHKYAKKVYGDRKIVEFAVSYYLKILSYFDIVNQVKRKYYWKNKKLDVPNHILKEILILYAHLRDDFEIDINRLHDEIAFSMFNLDNLESVLMEYNSIEWAYQKRVDSRKIIITKKYKKT